MVRLVDAFRRALGGVSSRTTLKALKINLEVLGLPVNDEKIGEIVVLSIITRERERRRVREREREKSFKDQSLMVSSIYDKNVVVLARYEISINHSAKHPN